MNIDVQQLQEKWEKLTISDREFCVDFLKEINKNKQLNEAQWYNTVGDILGIFDPTGVVDLINGISYMRQGDLFFGFLSMVAAIPYVGDFVAKPLIGIGKTSGLMKNIDRAMDLAKMGRTSEAGIILDKASRQSTLMSNFLKSVPRWGQKLKNAIDSLPYKKITNNFRRVIKDWIDLFSNIAKKRYAVRAVSTANLAKKLKKPLSSKDAETLILGLQKTIETQGRVFKNMKFAKDAGFMTKNVWPFITPGKMWRNRSVSAMMNRTKFYTGFLDYMGWGNFVGPEELTGKMSEEELNKKFQEYTKTSQAQQYWNEDMANLDSDQPEKDSYSSNTTDKNTSKDSSDPLDAIIDLFV